MGWFHILAAVGILVQVFVWTYVFIFLGSIPRSGISGAVTPRLTVEEVPDCFPQWLQLCPSPQQPSLCPARRATPPGRAEPRQASGKVASCLCVHAGGAPCCNRMDGPGQPASGDSPVQPWRPAVYAVAMQCLQAALGLESTVGCVAGSRSFSGGRNVPGRMIGTNSSHRLEGPGLINFVVF